MCQISIRWFEGHDTWVSELRGAPLVALEHPAEPSPAADRADGGLGWIGAGTTGGFTEEKCAQTVWGLRYIDDAVLRRTDTNQDYDYADAGERNDYYLTDPQFSVVAVVDSTGKLQERLAYSAYGEATHHFPADMDGDGDVDSTDTSWFTNLNNLKDIDESGYNPDGDLNRDGSVNTADLIQALNWNGSAALTNGLISDPDGPDNPIGYDGYLFSAETKLYTVRFRHYEPVNGRWVEQDPLGPLGGSLNLYQYVHCSPPTWNDPHGLYAEEPPKDHPIPLALGGSPDKQVCIEWDDVADHSTRHRCLAKELGLDKVSWPKMRDAFGKLSDAQRRKVIRNSLINAGVDPTLLTDEFMDASFADCTPGKKRTGKRKYPAVVRPDGKWVKGGLPAVFMLVAGYNSAQAAGAVFGHGGSPSCKNMLQTMKEAFAGTGGGACSVDCDLLRRGREDALDCALDLAVAISDGGMGDTASLTAWKAFGDKYDELVEKCEEGCASQTSTSSGGGTGE